jgi:hypothetical protein
MEYFDLSHLVSSRSQRADNASTIAKLVDELVGDYFVITGVWLVEFDN